MAIKSSDPRKLQDIDTGSTWFERIIVDAWETRNEGTGEVPSASRSTRQQNASVPGEYRNGEAAYHPFADLKDRLGRH
ncbi:MAG: hypothetical protein PVH31_09290 [Ectothiorhodospiraceae bacterium]|jgi:hypothetical protein